MEAANVWASSTLSGVESSNTIKDVALTIEKTTSILKNLDLQKRVLDALNIGAVGEDVLVYTSIFMLEGGASNLDEANKILTTSMPSQPPITLNADVDEALRFYDLMQAGESQGLGGMQFLSTHYSEDVIDVMGTTVNIKAFKDAFLEAVPLAGNAIQFYEKMQEGFSVPAAFEFGQNIANIWEEFEVRKEVLQDASVKFMEKYIEETANSVSITLSEPVTQRKLRLSVYDDEGRLAGFNQTSGNIEASIPGCYYFDLDNVTQIILPREIQIAKITVDAKDAESSVENYNLTVEVTEGGSLTGSTSQTGQINKGVQKEYNLQITNLEPTLNAISPYDYTNITIVAATTTAITVAAVGGLYQRKRKTKASKRLVELGNRMKKLEEVFERREISRDTYVKLKTELEEQLKKERGS